MKTLAAFGLVIVTILGSHLALAQPPEGRGGPPPRPHDGLREALDTNGDHELDADEIKNAATSLAKADRNGDGRIDHEEFRPPLPPLPPLPRGEGEFRGPPPRDRGDEDRPGREGREAREGRREGGPPREGRPLRDGVLRGEGGGRPGFPSPERFVERALSFDADGDGKLDRGELEKFAADSTQRMRAGLAERGMGPGAERGGGFRPEDRPRRRPEGDADGDRPERPRRPE